MLRIRDAQYHDLLTMLNIYNQAVLETTATFDLEVQTLEQRRVWFAHHGPRYPLVVAEEDGHVLGYCGLSPYGGKPGYRYTAEISIYIDHQQRGRGVGSQLMQHILDRAQRIGLHAILAHISRGNDASVRLHERFGFTFVGCLREVGHKFGQWQDVLIYQYMVPDVAPDALASAHAEPGRTDGTPGLAD